jgi:hypothetical protein
VSSVILGLEQSDVVQGGQITLQQQFNTYVGSGYRAPAADVTVTVSAAPGPSGGSGTPVPATSDGIQQIDYAQYKYTWACDPAQAPGDYLVTWTGTVGGQPQTYTHTVTVAAIATGTPAPGVYASVAQYRAWSGDQWPPDERMTVLLQRASEDLDGNLVGAVYPVNQNGMPTDAMVIDVFMRACCAQAQFLAADNDITGVKRQYSSTSMGGVSLTRVAAMTATPFPPLAPRAASILRTAGVLPNAPLINW